MKKIILALVGALALSACGADIGAGEQAVTTFHQQLDAGQYDAIAGAAGSEMPAAQLVPLLTQVHTNLGNVTASSRTGFNTAVNNGVHTVTLNYDTTFQRGSGTENFVLRVNDGHAQLIGYSVNAPALASTATGGNAATSAPDAAGGDNTSE